MAVKLNELEETGTRWKAPSEDYPQGSFINGTGKGKRDGSYAKAEWANDLFGAHAAILKNGGETPNGQVETANNSQVYNALKKIIKNDIDTLGGDPSTVASGTVNAITATFTKPVALDGGKLVKVRAIGANTSPTVTFNPNGLGAKPVVKGNDAPLAVGDIAGAGYWLTMIYDATLQKWVLQNPATGVTLVLPEASESTKGIVQLATQAEVTNGTDVPKAITPKQFKEATKYLGGGLPMGHLFAWPFKTPPDGSIQCNGSTYNRTLYADFFAYVSSKGWVKTEGEWNSIASANGGYCPWYSEGDGTTNFRTPKFAPFMQIAIASSDVGNYHKPALPTHSHEIYAKSGNSNRSAIPFYNDTSHSLITEDGTILYGTTNSAKSDIYGLSDTVQPESNEWMICVVVAGQATNIGSVDVGNVMSAVAQVQAQVGAIPTPSAYITKTWRSWSNWYRKWSDGFIEQGGLYTNTSNALITLTLNTAFSSTDYAFYRVPQWAGGSSSATYYCMGFVSKDKTSVQLQSDSVSYFTMMYWYACGY